MIAKHHRVYLQYQPDEAALQRLAEWQRAVMEANPQARPVAPGRVHLTVIHFGIIADVLRELNEQLPALDEAKFFQALEDFLGNTQAVLPKEAKLIPQKISLFGHTGSVVALSCRASDDLVKAHQVALEQLKDFFRTVGIAEPVGFMQGSPNFRFALTFRPHISLAKAARQLPLHREIDTQEPLTFQCMKLHYI